ncbi:MAG TPA: ATP-dependent helicase HrpB [Pyrinomonadaceae bacterium]|jgi:ATP-dependent helicase HrpB
MQPLPIDTLLPEIVASLRRSPNLVIEAAPGAGKTTRVPPSLLAAGLMGAGEVWVLEPRRLAARMAARRVAEELGEQLGKTVGYQVRFEEVCGPSTRLRFLTEGVFTRRLLSDPTLSKVGAVILDEFHERHLQGDLALAFLRRLQRASRPRLSIIAMSATLDAGPVASFLGDCPELRSEGKLFDVSVEHLSRPDERPLEIQVEAAVRKLLTEGLDGDVLVFLPGAAEIRRAQAACAELAQRADLLVVPLHGELPAAAQDRAVRPAERRKLILSTNVAETSITIEGVVAVIDSGLARVAGHSPWSGLPTLGVARISKASAAQRAGRAGRTRAGRCLRLYTAQDFAARAQYETPEIMRLDLADTALELHGAGVADLESFEWFEPPPAVALAAAQSLLQKVQAIDEAGQVTETGRRMLRLPLHPRLSRLIVEAERRGVKADACIVAALTAERDIRARQVLQDRSVGQRARARVHGSSDLLEMLDLFKEAERARFSPASLERMQLEPAAVRAVERVRRQLVRLTGSEGERQADSPEAELLISILAGYPDRLARVVKRRSTSEEPGSSKIELLLSGGGSAELAPESVVRAAQFLVAVDAQERREPGRAGLRSGRTIVRLASAVEPEWLLDLFADRISETREVKWDRERERVEVVERLSYDGLVLDESRAKQAVGPEVSRALAEAVLEKGWPSFIDAELVEGFLARVAFVAEAFPEAGIEPLEERDVTDALSLLCEGRRSFAELREAVRAGELFELLRARLGPEHLRLLEKMAPERVTLAGSGRKVKVNYERARPPWIASRLQDFFGISDGPRVAGGRVPLVLHLLAPNQRPVQVTTDLSGFWHRHYPQVRRQLSRRYPRHAWPEDPLKKG